MATKKSTVKKATKKVATKKSAVKKVAKAATKKPAQKRVAKTKKVAVESTQDQGAKVTPYLDKETGVVTMVPETV